MSSYTKMAADLRTLTLTKIIETGTPEQRAAAATGPLTATQAAKLARDRNPNVRLALTANPTCPTKELQHLTKNVDANIHHAAHEQLESREPQPTPPTTDLNNQEPNQHITRYLADRCDDQGAQHLLDITIDDLTPWRLAANPNISSETIKMITTRTANTERNAGTWYRLTNHPNTPPEVLEHMVTNTTPWFDQALGHRNTPPGLIAAALTKHPEMSLRHALTRTNLTGTDVTALTQKIEQHLEGPTHLPQLVAENQHAPATLIEAAARTLIRKRRQAQYPHLAAHPNLDGKHLTMALHTLTPIAQIDALTKCCTTPEGLHTAAALTKEFEQLTATELAALSEQIVQTPTPGDHPQPDDLPAAQSR